VYTANEDYSRTGAAPSEEKAEHQRIFREALDGKLGTGDVHVYLLSPEGRAVGGLDIGSAANTEKMLAALKRTAERFRVTAGAPAAAPRPQSVPPAAPDSLVLHLVARGFNKGSWREFPAENWIVYSREETKKLLPPAPIAPGTSWEADPELAARIMLRVHPQTEDTTSDTNRSRIERQALRFSLLSQTNDVARAWVDGELRMKRPFYPGRDDQNYVDARFAGVLEFDPSRRRIRSLRLVADPATYGKEGFGLAIRSLAPTDQPAPVGEVTLFDFETPGATAAWTNLAVAGAAAREPAVRVETAREHATRGAQSLRLTFQGGTWPAVTAAAVPPDWSGYHTFQADVTVSEPCLVGFLALQEKSSRGTGWDNSVSRWVKTELLRPGTTTVTALLHPNDWSALRSELGRVTAFDIFVYRPRVGETIYVDNVRLLAAREPDPPKPEAQFPVLGTDLTVPSVQELGKRMKPQWKPPVPTTVDQVEAAFRTRFTELRKTHPRAVLAILRDGEQGYDPRHPARVFAGWKDAYWSSHGPDGMTLDRAENFGKAASQEVFMRHRSPLMRVELGSIPRGSRILAAQLMIVRANLEYDKDRNPEQNPNMWVAEPCNRPWEENEVNAYEYARGKFWRAIGGMYYGEDPDFLPVYLAYGPGGGKVSTWDFTEAVRFWTDGKHPNHGFMLHSDAYDWLGRAWYREAPETRNRPALLVVYDPAR
jgi:hypothetical protein